MVLVPWPESLRYLPELCLCKHNREQRSQEWVILCPCVLMCVCMRACLPALSKSFQFELIAALPLVLLGGRLHRNRPLRCGRASQLQWMDLCHDNIPVTLMGLKQTGKCHDSIHEETCRHHSRMQPLHRAPHFTQVVSHPTRSETSLSLQNETWGHHTLTLSHRD